MFGRTRKSGFTLVEILIVVIILGILAAIVIPQFTNASQDARKSSLSSQLQTLQSQIELYKLNHHDQLPNLVAANGWDLLTQKTDDLHNVLADQTQPGFGPYLQQVPVNSLNNFSAIIDGTGAAGAAGAGFVYDYNGALGSGKVWGTDVDPTVIFVPN